MDHNLSENKIDFNKAPRKQCKVFQYDEKLYMTYVDNEKTSSGFKQGKMKLIRILEEKFKSYLKRGDIVTPGIYRNTGTYISNGKNLIELYYKWDDYGSLPPDFSYPEFPLNYWSTDAIDHNSIRWIDINSSSIFTNKNSYPTRSGVDTKKAVRIKDSMYPVLSKVGSKYMIELSDNLNKTNNTDTIVEDPVFGIMKWSSEDKQWIAKKSKLPFIVVIKGNKNKQDFEQYHNLLKMIVANKTKLIDTWIEKELLNSNKQGISIEKDLIEPNKRELYNSKIVMIEFSPFPMTANIMMKPKNPKLLSHHEIGVNVNKHGKVVGTSMHG